ncbi:MAG: PAS domain S-box protein [bacterium]|nr:PAS domain S-box protein [bacterium]
MAALGAAILPVWGWLQYSSGADVDEPLAIRGVLACFCAAFLVAALFSHSFVERIRPMAIALYWAITAFAGYLVMRNEFSMITSMGMLLVFVVVAAILDSRLELIVYTLAHLIFAAVAPRFVEQPEVTPWLYLISTLTVIVFSAAVHAGRLRNEHHRRKAEQALQQVLARLELEVAERTQNLQKSNELLVAEIASRGRAEKFLQARGRILEAISHGGQLNDQETLGHVLTVIREVDDCMLPVILMLDESGARLNPAAGPGLPEEFLNALRELPVAADSGPCAGAVFHRRPEWVADLLEEPAVAAVRPAIERAGLRSCCSVPLLDSAGRALGALSVYYTLPRTPDPIELEFISSCAHYIAAALERARTNAELELSRTRYRLATGAARVGVWDLNIRTMELYIDPIFKEMLGYQDTPDEHIPLKKLRLVLRDADRRVIMKAARTNLGRRSSSLAIEHRARCRNGEYIWLSTRGAAIRDEHGRPERLLGTGTDITDFKTTELALQENEAKFRSLSEAAFEGLLVLDGTNIRNANDKFCEMFGRKSEEIVGRDICEFIAADSLERLRECLDSMGCGVMEFEAVRRGGDSFPVEINASRFTQQGVDYRVAAFRDLTERRGLERTREMLSVLEKEKTIRDLRSRFVALASHEFRTPLATIQSTADLLVQYPDRIDEEKSADYLKSIQTEVGHMTELLDDILLFGQADAGKFSFRPEPLDVGALCAELVEKFERSPGNRNRIDCSFNAESRPHLDERMVRLIVTNLISNALKYSPADGLIEIRVESDRDGTILEVADQGIGIAEEDRALLFSPFHRGANVGGRSGTGLGLAVAKMAAEMHGGTIELDPRAGQGTRMRVHLPMARTEIGVPIGVGAQ